MFISIWYFNLKTDKIESESTSYCILNNENFLNRMVRAKDCRDIYRLLSYMNKDEGSEANHCCQVFTNFSASVTKFICHIFCTNFVIMHFVTLNFVMYNLC